MSTDAVLNDHDLEFLGRPLFGFISTAAGPQPPQPRPVWFEATIDRTIQLFTAPDSLKARRLHRDPRASILVATPVGERERWISIAGRTTIEPLGPDEARDLCSRLAARYWQIDEQARSAAVAVLLAVDQVRVVIHPETVHRFTN